MSIRPFYLPLLVGLVPLPLAAPTLLPPGPPEGPPLAGFTGLAVLFQRVQPLLPVPLPVPPPLLFATISLHPVFSFRLASIYLTITMHNMSGKYANSLPELIRQAVAYPNIYTCAVYFFGRM